MAVDDLFPTSQEPWGDWWVSEAHDIYGNSKKIIEQLLDVIVHHVSGTLPLTIFWGCRCTVCLFSCFNAFFLDCKRWCVISCGGGKWFNGPAGVQQARGRSICHGGGPRNQREKCGAIEVQTSSKSFRNNLKTSQQKSTPQTHVSEAN